VTTIVPASEMLLETDLLRASPVQARSNKRVGALLDAAAVIIHRRGYEELTTAAVANEAGASIGTVYRYFEDRVAVLKALATRNFERTAIAFSSALEDSKPATPSDAIDVLFVTYLSLFRSELGYRSLRMGDVLDIRPFDGALASRRSCELLAKRLEVLYGLTATEDNVLLLELGYVTMDALLGRAFANSDKGDAAFIEAARKATSTVAAALR
jgi:AcrR family transcriptional regulator